MVFELILLQSIELVLILVFMNIIIREQQFESVLKTVQESFRKTFLFNVTYI